MKKETGKEFFSSSHVHGDLAEVQEAEQYRHEAHHVFDEAHVLHELKHYLPSQTPLKDFIHHNSLHAFQHMKFYEAIFTASKIFGFQVHLQLSEYRELYKTGRIRADILDKIISDKKGNTQE